MTVTTVTRSVIPGIVTGYRFFSLYEDYESLKECEVSPKGWGIRYSAYENDDRAVLVSEEFDKSILDKLLTKYDMITVVSLKGYRKYLSTLDQTVRALVMETRGTSEQSTLNAYDYIQLLGRNSSIGAASAGTDYRLEGNPVLYFTGAPEVMLSLWNKYTDYAEISLYVQVEDGIQHIDISNHIADLCTRHEVLQSAGCLACPHRANCVQHLLQEEVVPIDLDIQSLKKVAAKLDISLLPHSDCKDTNKYTSGKIDVRDINLAGALVRHHIASARRKSIKLNKKFYKDNCSGCSLSSVCGTSKSYNQEGDSARSYCEGKVPDYAVLEVTVDNYVKYLEVMLTSLLTIANKELAMTFTALELITAWVETSCNSVPKHASYFISRFSKARKKNMAHQEYYVVPEQLVKLAELFAIRGSFDGRGNGWYSHGIGDWLGNSTNSITSLLPVTSQSSGWFAIARAHTDIKAPDYYDRTRHECIDTKVLYSVLGAKSSYRSKVFSTKESRLQLALEFIAQFLSPGSTYWYGPYGNSRAWVPSGVPSRWSWSWTNKEYQALEVAFPVRTPTQNLVSVLAMLREVDTNLDLLGNNNKLREVILNG